MDQSLLVYVINSTRALYVWSYSTLEFRLAVSNTILIQHILNNVLAKHAL